MDKAHKLATKKRTLLVQKDRAYHLSTVTCGGLHSNPEFQKDLLEAALEDIKGWLQDKFLAIYER